MTSENIITPEYRVVSEDGREIYFGRDLRLANDHAGVNPTATFYERKDPSHPSTPWVVRKTL